MQFMEDMVAVMELMPVSLMVVMTEDTLVLLMVIVMQLMVDTLVQFMVAKMELTLVLLMVVVTVLTLA